MISAVIIAKNEQKNIKKAIDSVAFCDEVVVIDNGSDDKTVSLAKSESAKIYSISTDDFSEIRNFALKKVQHEWVLFIDADERVSTELKEEIIKSVKENINSAYYLRRRDFFFNKEMKWGEVLKMRNKGLIRLVKKKSGLWTGYVHEEYKTENNIGRLNNFINHYPHQTIAEFLSDINYYSTLRAQELHSQNKRTSLFNIVIFPLVKFFYTFVLLLGFLDGAEGFIYSFMMSFYSFLVQAKLFLIQDKKISSE